MFGNYVKRCNNANITNGNKNSYEPILQFYQIVRDIKFILRRV